MQIIWGRAQNAQANLFPTYINYCAHDWTRTTIRIENISNRHNHGGNVNDQTAKPDLVLDAGDSKCFERLHYSMEL